MILKLFNINCTTCPDFELDQTRWACNVKTGHRTQVLHSTATSTLPTQFKRSLQTNPKHVDFSLIHNYEHDTDNFLITSEGNSEIGSRTEPSFPETARHLILEQHSQTKESLLLDKPQTPLNENLQKSYFFIAANVI
jgi:hypothetical protein